VNKVLLIIKAGGDLVKEGLPKVLLNDIKNLRKHHQLVLIHGGGDIVTEISIQLGHTPRFVTSPKGFKSRYTSKEESKIFTMVMAGKINKNIVNSLEKEGITSIGLTGLDAHLLKASRKKQLIIIDERGRKKLIKGGYTGKVEEVNSDILRMLLDNGIIPVLSPIATGENNEFLNVDGDRTAAAVASALKADRLILLTDVKGVRLNNKYIPHLTLQEAEDAIKHIGAGMITKVYAALEAIKNGVEETMIASGFNENPVSSALKHHECTVIKR
jgi:acetylglutamate/LysW-gamma-L-alpha-aminoadipate kinase